MNQNLLRKQVRAELRKRSYVIYTSLVLGLIYIALNLVFGETGLLRFRELRRTHQGLSSEVSRMREENSRLRASLKTYGESDFLVEKHSREDFGLARPDEYIFLYEQR